MEINIQTYSQDRFFKVLTKDAKSAHGGKFDWTPYLPKFDKDRNLWMPGEWTPKVDPSICHTGYHLTSDPLRWFINEGRLFLCEYSGKVSSDNTDKTAFESVRMLRECDKDDMNIKARLFVLLASRSDLARANLSGANLYGANLYGANLSRANLYGANLSGADLSRANLSGADLSRANLYGANLYGADLSRANLSGANLSRADLSRANLSGADLFGAYIDRNPCISGWKFENGQLWKED